MTAKFIKHVLRFKIPGGTSRGVLTEKDTYFIVIEDDNRIGIGECGLLRGLSVDDRPDYEDKLDWVCKNIQLSKTELIANLTEFPSIQFGIETAFKSLEAEKSFELFPSDFTRGNEGISINGLVWMGDEQFMKNQISDKLNSGFTTIKMKIGAIDFDTEIKLLQSIRASFSAKEITLRLDANGAFSFQEAKEKLKRLSELEIHSIEQPIEQGNLEKMAALCQDTPIPIALDEELIGAFSDETKKNIIETVNPQYIILKPSLIGGFQACETWISLIENNGGGWWITSALESNIGLNAIAQYTYQKKATMPQGLGTGSLYTNNIPSPLEVKQGTLYYNSNEKWNFSFIN
ncbi:MAG: o-succinylbenzoate synthase [Bacteroidetes bacterium]|jgi:o-succinylbenzoate synthase|nr:o-succinylbenzoate synthase [Bacteroidota bacterium]